MDPFPGKLLEVGEEESMGSGSLGEPGRQRRAAPRGQNPGFLWHFPPEGLLWSKRLFSQRVESQETVMGTEATGKGAGGGSEFPHKAVGDRSSRGSGTGTEQPEQTFLRPAECPEDRN